MTPTEIAMLTNAGLDILAALRQNGVEITSKNIDERVAQRQAEADEIDRRINEDG
jgi:hypothetical protein